MKLKEQIKDKGIKFKWLANKLGVKQPELSMWLNEVRPMPEHIERQIKLLIK